MEYKQILEKIIVENNSFIINSFLVNNQFAGIKVFKEIVQDNEKTYVEVFPTEIEEDIRKKIMLKENIVEMTKEEAINFGIFYEERSEKNEFVKNQLNTNRQKVLLLGETVGQDYVLLEKTYENKVIRVIYGIVYSNNAITHIYDIKPAIQDLIIIDILNKNEKLLELNGVLCFPAFNDDEGLEKYNFIFVDKIKKQKDVYFFAISKIAKNENTENTDNYVVEYPMSFILNRENEKDGYKYLLKEEYDKLNIDYNFEKRIQDFLQIVVYLNQQ